MDNTEIKFTIKDHDSITSTAEGVKDMKEMWNKQMIDVTSQIKDHDGRIRRVEDYVVAAKSERKIWSVLGGIVGGIAVVVVGGLLLHLLGKI